jgi:hypothetical protein
MAARQSRVTWNVWPEDSALPLAISVARCTTARASTASYTRAQNSKAPTKAVVCAYPSTKRCACRSRPAPLRNVPNFRSSRYRFVMAMMATTIFAAITEHSVQKMMWYILFPLSADTPFAKLRLDLCGSRGGRGRGRHCADVKENEEARPRGEDRASSSRTIGRGFRAPQREGGVADGYSYNANCGRLFHGQDLPALRRPTCRD